ncbi:MAG: polysaccharide lyase [Pirellulaceae bacterium]|nr:polysaccharide lyase [Pirellulaceae bacterium]
MRGVNYLWAVLMLLCVASGSSADEPPSPADARRALRRAVEFFQDQVSADGGFLWQYSADLARREGEGQAGPLTAWVQPPGTPSVGQVLLLAHQRTGDAYYLEAARRTAHALVRGQLESGGWDYRIEMDPAQRSKIAYRADGPAQGKRGNTTTLDDNTTQAALQFLMNFDQATGFTDKKVHEAVQYALQRLVEAQYPNGAWPQRFSEPPDAASHPVLKSQYPDSWSRTWPSADYRGYYTFNDNSIADMIAVMLEAARIYQQPRWREAAERAGDFILLAQMPDPQPAWAQQYNAAMQPAWARKFEPPAITGGESQRVLRTLLVLYRATGQKKFLEPIPRALAYLKQSQLPDGRLARFYELRTNRPLYFTKDYKLTYADDDLPTHYAFQVGSSVQVIESDYQRALAETPPASSDQPPAAGSTPPRFRLTRELQAAAQAICQQQDQRGAWVEEGRLRSFGPDDPATRIISTRTFIQNVDQLSRYVAALPRD